MFFLRTEARDNLENPSTDLIAALSNPFLTDGLTFGGNPIAGVIVNEETALTFGAVYAAVRVIAETTGSLPFHLYRTQGRSRIQADDDARAYLLNEEPNPEMDSMTFWEMVIGHCNLWGNAYIYKDIHPGTGMTLGLYPLMPNQTRPVKLPTGDIAFVTQLDTGELRTLVADQVIHVRAFGTGKGNAGISPIGVARRAIGIGIAGDEYAGRFFANDGRPGGIITTDQTLSDSAYETFKRRYDAGHKGLTNSHLVTILDGGKKWQDVGMPQGDVQFLESRKWQKREIATIFRVPPHKIGDAEPGAVSYASVEQFNLDFVTDTIRPWATRIEKAIKRGLFGSEPDRAEGLYGKFNLNALMRADGISRSTYYKNMVDMGAMTIAEVREYEDLTYMDGTDELRPLLAATAAPPAPQHE